MVSHAVPDDTQSPGIGIRTEKVIAFLDGKNLLWPILKREGINLGLKTQNLPATYLQKKSYRKYSGLFWSGPNYMWSCNAAKSLSVLKQDMCPLPQHFKNNPPEQKTAKHKEALLHARQTLKHYILRLYILDILYP